jgi:porphobilinogen synthase
MAFPITRLRRLRQSKIMRDMVRETEVNCDDLIMPYFVCPGTNVKNPIASMPGNFQLSIDMLVKEVKGDVHNDLTLETLANQSVIMAEAGADIIAPSDMMDGRVGAIRTALDSHGYTNIPIMAYSAKFASAFYGPFRDAAGSAPQFGNRNTYQMDPANSDEALREVEQDILEGADMVMVKPALSYLDVIQRVKTSFNIPVVAYNVSGEFSMVKAAGANGWVDEERMIKEILTSIKRAGADVIISYHAKEFGIKKMNG